VEVAAAGFRTLRSGSTTSVGSRELCLPPAVTPTSTLRWGQRGHMILNSYAGGSGAGGRICEGGPVKSDNPDKNGYHSPSFGGGGGLFQILKPN
jgi:hypothetical protein